jgi:hypothetical protein
MLTHVLGFAIGVADDIPLTTAIVTGILIIWCSSFLDVVVVDGIQQGSVSEDTAVTASRISILDRHR